MLENGALRGLGRGSLVSDAGLELQGSGPWDFSFP